MPTPPAIRRTSAILLALLIWLLLALGWSGFLIRGSFERFSHNLLAERARQIAALIAENPAGAGEALDQMMRSDGHLAYIMAWTEAGQVLLHTRHSLAGTSLDVSKWPALERGQGARFTMFAPSSASAEEVTEITIPLLAPGITATSELPAGTHPASQARAFLSVAYPSDFLNAQFHLAARPLLIDSLIFTVAGAMLLVVAMLLAFGRLERSRREIEQNARARTSLLTERGMLASVLAHEVRSPLTALRFNLHSLRSLMASDEPGASADKQLELTDRCEREIRRLDGMLGDFLERTQVFSPSDSGSGTSLNAVIREAVEFLTPALERRNIRVSLHLDESDPRVPIHADELRQVILNLAANAQEAMPPPQGGTLAISTLAPASSLQTAPADTVPHSPLHTQYAQLSASSVTLLFRDSGIGIPTENLERIFEPFFSTKPNGSGLGLTLVRRVISGAGGTLFVESISGEGTTFRILLPPNAAAPPPEHTTGATPPENM